MTAAVSESETYYKLAVWDERSLCFRVGKRGYGTREAARAAAKAAGRYLITEVTAEGRVDGEPFDVAGEVRPSPSRNRVRGGLRSRPGLR